MSGKRNMFARRLSDGLTSLREASVEAAMLARRFSSGSPILKVNFFLNYQNVTRTFSYFVHAAGISVIVVCLSVSSKVL